MDAEVIWTLTLIPEGLAICEVGTGANPLCPGRMNGRLAVAAAAGAASGAGGRRPRALREAIKELPDPDGAATAGIGGGMEIDWVWRNGCAGCGGGGVGLC